MLSQILILASANGHISIVIGIMLFLIAVKVAKKTVKAAMTLLIIAVILILLGII